MNFFLLHSTQWITFVTVTPPLQLLEQSGIVTSFCIYTRMYILFLIIIIIIVIFFLIYVYIYAYAVIH